MAEFESDIEARSVTPGWIATVHHGDGTSTDYWAPTEGRARQKATSGGDA